MAKPDTSFSFGANARPRKPRKTGGKKRRRSSSKSSKKYWSGQFGS